MYLGVRKVFVSTNFHEPMNFRILLISTLAIFGICAHAQPPTSLSYPGPNVFVANVSNVYMAPTVAGNVSSYSITPALPAGLSFNTNTGIISGIPTVASAATVYTITATGGSPSGSTNTTVSIQVTNNYFNNNYNSINFGGTGVTITNKVGTGAAVGNIVLYQNVATLSGQSIDAIVRTTSLTGGTISTFDQAAESGSGWSSNNARFFSPQFNFTAAGNARFDFQFILGGSYNNTTNTGMPVVLQNVQINTYDIDGNGNANSNQYNEFGGFNTSELGSATTVVASYNATAGLTKYRSNTTTNSTAVTADPTRVRVTYSNVSDFTIVVGADAQGAAYFFLDMGAGPAFSTAVATPAPSIDLNTSMLGVGHAATGCGTSLAFTAASQTNIAASPATLNELKLSFATSDLKNGASEQLLVNGATSGGTIALNFANAATIPNVVVGGVTYKVTATVSGGISTLSFTNNAGGTFTQAQAETLLDAFRYNNAAATPTPGDRNFTVNVRNTTFESPDAVFTATLNCVSISGFVFRDANGLTDNIINAVGAQFAANGIYVVRVNPSNNQVIDSRGVAAGGAYNFGTVAPGRYALFLSNNQPAVGSIVTAPTYPAGGFISMGEHLGTGAGNDLLVDGKLLVTIGSSNITEADFGVEIPPVTANSSLSNQPNPGGYNNYTLPAGSFNVSDADGSVTSITVTEYPTGANYLKIGTTVYVNPSGGICPPLTTCTAWPGTVTVPYSGNTTTQAISVDPAADVTTSVAIKFTGRDNANVNSNTSTLTIPFVVTSYQSISGFVWHDYNGNGTKESAEAYLNTANSGQTLYAILVQNTNTYSGVPTVYAASAVSNTTGYSFSNIAGGNNYEVRIASLTAAPVYGSAASAVTPNLASGWNAVSTNKAGVITTNLNTYNPVITFTSLASSQSNNNFGIQQMPVADVKNYEGVNTRNGGSLTNVTIANTNDASVTYIKSMSMSGTSSDGNTPGMFTGTDPDGGPNGTPLELKSGSSGISLVIDPASYSNDGGISAYPTMMQYSGVQLQTGGCKGADVGKSFCNNYNTTSGYWEIPNYNEGQAQLLGTEGTRQMGFSYAWKDAAGTRGSFNNYSAGFSQPLPLKLVNFSAKKQSDNTILLQWNTEGEYNTSHFDVEHSKDGLTFNKVGNVKAAGQADKKSYRFLVKKVAAGTNFYRLGMYDLDASFTFSFTVAITMGEHQLHAKAYPNPVASGGEITVSAGQVLNDKTEVTVYDPSGRPVYKTVLNVSGKAVIPVRNWPAGVYIIQLQNGKAVENLKLVVNQP